MSQIMDQELYENRSKWVDLYLMEVDEDYQRADVLLQDAEGYHPAAYALISRYMQAKRNQVRDGDLKDFIYDSVVSAEDRFGGKW